MRSSLRVTGAAHLLGVLLVAVVGQARADASHAIAMYGKPALPPDFVALPYANPDAPKGGRIVYGVAGSFDSLNPFILEGTAPWAMRAHAFESLMGRNWDEPFTLYGLLAESIETGPNRRWVEFTLRDEARFSDGAPVTVADVLWSFRTLGTEGHPRYRTAWSKVARAEAIGPRSLRITFDTADRELPLIFGLQPILRKAQWAERDFTESGLTAPIGSAPYVVSEVEPGRALTFERNPDYWGADLAFNNGRHNFETIRYEFYADADIVFESFRGGALNTFRESDPARWESSYDFPAVRSGAVVKSEIPHDRPSGIAGLVMNTRRAIFADWRVRAAMIHAFNYEFIAATLGADELPRITSYFSNSDLGMAHGPAEGRVRELLAPFADTLAPGALEGYSLPAAEGRTNRTNIREAFRLLREAGWHVAEDGVLRDAEDRPFRVEVLLEQGAGRAGRIVNIYAEALRRLGIRLDVVSVDSAQYQSRTDAYDFDMAWYERALSLSPGNEQRLYWGSEGVDTPGTRNWMGVDSAAVDTLIAKMLASGTRADFVAAVRALDRTLTAGRYVIPVWYSDVSRIAHSAALHYPERTPLYGDWIGFQPDVWWYAE